jgi:hypothetical protein
MVEPSRSRMTVVKKTVVEQSQGATIRGFGEEKENGQTTMSGNLTYQM